MTPAATQLATRFDGSASGVTAACLDEESNRVFVASERDGLLVYDLHTGRFETVSNSSEGIRGMVPAAGRSYLIAWSERNIVWQWSVGEPARMDQLASPVRVESACGVESKGSRIAAGSLETPDLVILAHGENPAFHTLHTAPITHVELRLALPLVTTSLDGTIGIWEPRTLQPLAEPLRGHTDAVWGGMVVGDYWVVSYSADQTLRSWSWDANTLRPAAVMRGHTNQISGIALGRSGEVVSGSWDGTLRTWKIDSGEELQSIPLGRGRITHVATSPSGRIAAATADRTITLVDGGAVTGVFPGVSTCTTLGLTDDVVFSGDVSGNFWILDTGAAHEKIKLPAHVAILTLKDNMDIASELVKHADLEGPQYVRMHPVEIESEMDRPAPESVLNSYPVVLVLACNSLTHSRYRTLLDQVLRRAVYRNLLMVAFEDANRWKGSRLAGHRQLGWPASQSDYRSLMMALRAAVRGSSSENENSPNEATTSPP